VLLHQCYSPDFTLILVVAYWDMVRTTFSHWNVVPGSTKYANMAKSGHAGLWFMSFVRCTPKGLLLCKKIFSRFVITTYFLLSNQLYNNLFSSDNILF